MLKKRTLLLTFNSLLLFANCLYGTEKKVEKIPKIIPDSVDAPKNVLSVAKTIESLLIPSDIAIQMRQQKLETKPYIKIIPGKENSTLIYRCRFSKAKELENSVDSIVSNKGSVEVADDQNMIIVHDLPDKMDEIKETLLAIDVAAPQILVEAKIVEVLLSDGMQRNLSFAYNVNDDGTKSSVGFKTSVPSQDESDKGQGSMLDWTPFVSGDAASANYKNFSVALQWLLKAQDAKILSAPNIVVSRNATASIVTGQDIPIQTIQVNSGSTTTSTDFRRVGVKLNVTPSLINNETVILQVNPQVSNVQQYKDIKQNDTNFPVPIIAIRNIETMLRLYDGQIIVLGGLYTHNESVTEERVPFLSDIPFIGELFTGKNKQREIVQLIFFLKVSILNDAEMIKGVLYDPGTQAKRLREIGKTIKDSKDIFPEKEPTIEQIKREFLEKDDSFK